MGRPDLLNCCGQLSGGGGLEGARRDAFGGGDAAVRARARRGGPRVVEGRRGRREQRRDWQGGRGGGPGRREGEQRRRKRRRGGGRGHRSLGLSLDDARLCLLFLEQQQRHPLPSLRARRSPARPRPLRRRRKPRRRAHAQRHVVPRPRDPAMDRPLPPSLFLSLGEELRRVAAPSRGALPAPLEEGPAGDRGTRPQERQGRAAAHGDGGVEARARERRRQWRRRRAAVDAGAHGRRRGVAAASAEGGALGDRDPGNLPRVCVW